MQSFSLLVKPASADCNLACSYCFYARKKELYPESSAPRMDAAILDILIRRYMETAQPVYSMIWQGGEPALMGQSFFEQVIAAQKQYAPRGAYIANSLQTNGTLVNGKLSKLLKKYCFLVGCSIDGPAVLHDLHRKDCSGRGSHARVLRGVRLLREQGISPAALVLVSSGNVSEPLQVYRYLLAQGFDNLQFIPCVEFAPEGLLQSFSISGQQWGRFLLAVFNEWYAHKQWNIIIRNFESIAAQCIRAQPAECRFCTKCDQYLVIEYNGDIYPCDFFVEERYKLGNIREMTFEEARNSSRYREFSNSKSQVPQECAECEYLALCLGDCLHYRPMGDTMRRSVLCDGWRLFFDATKKKFAELARTLAA